MIAQTARIAPKTRAERPTSIASKPLIQFCNAKN